MVLPYFALEQYEKAVTSFEKGMKNIRELSDNLPFAAASYAYLDRKEEAKATVDKWNEKIGGRLHIDRFYSAFPLRDAEVFDRLINGLAIAGREGSIRVNIKINEKDKLTGQEIKDLVFGKTEATSLWAEDRFHRKENGEVLYQVGDSIKKGVSWIKNDMLCNKVEKIAGGYENCADIYKNPTGEKAFKNEYLKVTYFNIIPFSIEQ